MMRARYIALTVVQADDICEAQLRLTDHHKDGSREELCIPLRIPAVRDAEDIESWCREHLAAAIEVI